VPLREGVVVRRLPSTTLPLMELVEGERFMLCREAVEECVVCRPDMARAAARSAS
jgi:hypothetical protein